MGTVCGGIYHFTILFIESYKTIVIDPPWEYGKWGKASEKAYAVSGINEKTNIDLPIPYETMSVKEIKDLPIPKLAAENCELYLWVTQKYIPDSFNIIAGWGFKYCQTIVWCKTPRGTGQGGVYCPTNEFLILARKGKMPKVTRINSTWFHTKRPHNSHSTKPEFFQDMIESVSEGPRLEMFARRQRSGWDVFGNEVENSINLKQF